MPELTTMWRSLGLGEELYGCLLSRRNYAEPDDWPSRGRASAISCRRAQQVAQQATAFRPQPVTALSILHPDSWRDISSAFNEPTSSLSLPTPNHVQRTQRAHQGHQRGAGAVAICPRAAGPRPRRLRPAAAAAAAACSPAPAPGTGPCAPGLPRGEVLWRCRDRHAAQGAAEPQTAAGEQLKQAGAGCRRTAAVVPCCAGSRPLLLCRPYAP